MSGRAHGARIVAKLREAAEKGSFSSSVSTILNRCVNKIATYPSTVSSQSRNVIFANNYLNMGDIKVMGFDLDYTLVSYTVELQSLIFTLARNVLVNIYGYPRDLMASQFDPHFAIRGLSVDSQSGVLCKLSHLQRVSAKFAYKGKKPLSSEMVEKLYGESRHIAHGDLKKMRPLNDMFSLAEGCLIAEVIELFEHNKTHRAEEYEPAMLINDIQEAIRDVHVSGTMHEMVSKDCERYINVNKKLPDMLQRLINADKKLFLCTNRCLLRFISSQILFTVLFV